MDFSLYIYIYVYSNIYIYILIAYMLLIYLSLSYYTMCCCMQGYEHATLWRTRHKRYDLHMNIYIKIHSVNVYRESERDEHMKSKYPFTICTSFLMIRDVLLHAGIRTRDAVAYATQAVCYAYR